MKPEESAVLGLGVGSGAILGLHITVDGLYL